LFEQSRLLDSRCLRNTDLYGRRLVEPGCVRYQVVPAGDVRPSRSRKPAEFTIEVRPADPQLPARQHEVLVRVRRGALVADPDHVVVRTGDLVAWTAAGANIPPFAIEGRTPQASFSSTVLTQNSLYAHAFEREGIYGWSDQDGTVRGQIVVSRPAPEALSSPNFAAYVAARHRVHVIRVRGSTAKPRQIHVAVNAMVFWTVVDGPPISVTSACDTGPPG
jgi:plastocyanin